MQMEDRRHGSKKQVVDLNLVPFIDLMSVCIIFLLISAVWTQISMLQLGNSIYSNKTDEEVIKPPPFVEIALRVDVLPQGFRLVVGKDAIMIPAKSSSNVYNVVKLKEELRSVKEKYPSKVDGVASVRDEIQYKHLIQAMDALLLTGFNQVSITTTGVL